MLYAANIDGNIQPEEVRIMLEKTDFDTVEKVEKLFDKMSDTEILDCITESKNTYASTEEDRLGLIADMVAIIEADENCSLIEEQIVKGVNRLLQ